MDSSADDGASVDGAESPSARRHYRLLYLLSAVLVAAVTIGVFARASGFDFLLWDDDIQITRNPTVGNLDWVTAWRMFSRGYAIRYQPLSWFSSAVLARLGGVSPVLFHSYNVILHALSAVLVLAILRRLVIRAGYAEATSLGVVLLAPAFGALVFALHPLRVEPVTWATGWRYCQSMVLMLASASLYFRAIARRPACAMRTSSYWLSALLFALSAFTYPFCLEWPLALVVLDIYLFDRWRVREAWLEKLPFALVSASVIAISVAIRLTTDVAKFAPTALADYGVASRLMKAFVVWADATWRGILPVGLQPIYVGSTPFHPLSVRAIVSAIALVGITVFLLRLRRSHPILLTLWLVHAALLGAKLGLLESGHVEAADRFTYPAGIAWAALATCGFIAVGGLHLGRLVRVPIALALVGWLGLASTRQQAIWRNNVTFFEAALAGVGNTGPRDDLLWRLAITLWQQGDPTRALALLDEAVQRRPADLRPRLMRAGVLGKLGRVEESHQEMSEAMRLTGASTPQEALARISAIVQLPSTP